MTATLFHDVDHRTLAKILSETADCSPASYLTAATPAAKAAIRARARRSSLWRRLDQLNAAAPIPVLRRSAYRDYQRCGRRDRWETPNLARRARLDDASMALWLDHPRADLDHVQDLLWTICEDWTWVMPAHESLSVDLGSVMCARLLAETVMLHRSLLEAEVIARVTTLIDERIWSRVCDPARTLWWRTVDTNWNLVCWGDTIRSALCLIDDPQRLANILHPAVSALNYGIAGFTADGGCVEGPGYWDYGFGFFARAALALHQRTAGRINLLDNESCRRIARFPLAASLRGKERALFADCRSGFISSETALAINALCPTPELLAFCKADPSGRLDCHSLHDLALSDGRPLPHPPDVHDALLPDLGLAKLQGRPGRSQLTLFCLGGHNGVPHNHNDLGSFVLYRGLRDLLTDPGGPRYTRDTFGPKRYDNVYCSADGHSVPVVNGVRQEVGSEYRATVTTVVEERLKTATVDLSAAYPKRAGLRSFHRTFRLDAKANHLELEDVFAFSRQPRSLECRFISLDRVRITKRGRQVLIGDGAARIVLSTTVAGRFSVEVLAAEAKANGKDQVISRISFIPARLARETTLRFSISI